MILLPLALKSSKVSQLFWLLCKFFRRKQPFNTFFAVFTTPNLDKWFTTAAWEVILFKLFNELFLTGKENGRKRQRFSENKKADKNNERQRPGGSRD